MYFGLNSPLRHERVIDDPAGSRIQGFSRRGVIVRVPPPTLSFPSSQAWGFAFCGPAVTVWSHLMPSATRDERGDGFRSVALHAGCDVAEGAQGDADRGVPHALLDDLRVHAGLQGQRRPGVPEAVEREAGESVPFDSAGELTGDAFGVRRFSGDLREYEVVVCPAFTAIDLGYGPPTSARSITARTCNRIVPSVLRTWRIGSGAYVTEGDVVRCPGHERDLL